MKKLLTLICAVISLTLIAFTGCGSDTFTAKSYTSGETVIESVLLDVADRQIDIGVSDDGQVHVDYFDGKKEYFDITVSESNVLSVKLEYNKSWTDYIGKKADSQYRKITVKIPTTVNALTLYTTNENINIETLNVANRISVSNNGGNINFNKISVGKSINLSAKNGDIKGTVVGGWDDFEITCSIKKGDSNLPAEKSGGDKSLTATCNNGDVNINFVKE